MAKKAPTPTDPKAVAAAMKRVMPLVKALPKEERLKESQILASALRGAALVHRTKTSDESGSPIVFGGDVVIEGSLGIGCVCVVLGNLTVRDALTASRQQTMLVVGGTLRAGGVICRGQIRVAGAVETEVAFVETSSVLAAKTLLADLVLLESDASELAGKVKAKSKISLTYPDTKGLEKLRRVLHPKAFGTVDGDDALYDFTNLERALRRRKPWRAEG
jgi:hypothetical protein